MASPAELASVRAVRRGANFQAEYYVLQKAMQAVLTGTRQMPHIPYRFWGDYPSLYISEGYLILRSPAMLSNHLRKFLELYLEWAAHPATSEGARGVSGAEFFDTYSGLCYNYGAFLRIGLNLPTHERLTLREELSQLLLITTGDDEFPFGAEDYCADCQEGTHHLNSTRLEWIHVQLEKCND